MAELTPNKPCKSESAAASACTSPLNPNESFENLIYVRYLDHVHYNRSSALLMGPQTREAIGWLVYDCDLYLILSWDRDAGPPTLKGGDPKASGLVLLKSDIVRLITFCPEPLLLQKSPKWLLNSANNKSKDEYALQPTKRKTPGAKDSTKNTGDRATCQ